MIFLHCQRNLFEQGQFCRSLCCKFEDCHKRHLYTFLPSTCTMREACCYIMKVFDCSCGKRLILIFIIKQYVVYMLSIPYSFDNGSTADSFTTAKLYTYEKYIMTPLEIVGTCHLHYNIMGEHCVCDPLMMLMPLYARGWLLHITKFSMTNNIILGHSLLSKMTLYLKTAIVFLLFLLPAWCYKNLTSCWPSHISINIPIISCEQMKKYGLIKGIT